MLQCLFQVSYTSWTHHSPECRLFDVLLTESGPVIGQHLGDAMDVFTETLDSQKKDPELRLKYELNKPTVVLTYQVEM